jgi:hypothetical protein
MLVIGIQYSDYCNNAALYLAVAGTLGFFSAAVMSVIPNRLCLVFWFARLGVLIWGSVVVFGSYGSWTYEDPNSSQFCHPVPFTFAFVIILISRPPTLGVLWQIGICAYCKTACDICAIGCNAGICVCFWPLCVTYTQRNSFGIDQLSKTKSS